jgi:hypothetical protein
LVFYYENRTDYLSSTSKSYHDPYNLVSKSPIFHGLSFGIKFIMIAIQNYSATPWQNIFGNRVYNSFFDLNLSARESTKIFKKYLNIFLTDQKLLNLSFFSRW